jgi:hypothetical protein
MHKNTSEPPPQVKSKLLSGFMNNMRRMTLPVKLLNNEKSPIVNKNEKEKEDLD